MARARVLYEALEEREKAAHLEHVASAARRASIDGGHEEAVPDWQCELCGGFNR